MINSVSKLEPIQGLSKREQSKLERLMKSDQIHRAQQDAKSYKRKASKTRHPDEPKPRKLHKLLNEGPSNNGSVPEPQEPNSKSSPSSAMSAKKELKVLTPFNSSLPIQGGVANLFDYLVGYVYNHKMKQFDAEYEDTTFLNNLGEKQLEILPNQTQISLGSDLAKQFQQQKKKITRPFDERHRSFLKKISSKQAINS